jgi:hypothetical protein
MLASPSFVSRPPEPALPADQLAIVARKQAPVHIGVAGATDQAPM